MPDPRNSSAARHPVMSYLRTHCTEPDLSVDIIARDCVLSRRALYRLNERTFYRTFRATTEFTPLEYRIAARRTSSRDVPMR